MAISTYAELVAALDGATGYLHRTDLTAKIPDFIRLAESEIASDLHLIPQEVETTLTATIGSRLMAVPTRFGKPLALWITTYSPRVEMIYRNAAELPVTTNNSPSDFYTVDGAYIATENPADVAYTYLLRYLATLDVATTLTNTVLTNWPRVYIFGALLQSMAYTRDLSQAQYWTSEYNSAILKALRDTNAVKSKQTLRADYYLHGRRDNINRGF